MLCQTRSRKQNTAVRRRGMFHEGPIHHACLRTWVYTTFDANLSTAAYPFTHLMMEEKKVWKRKRSGELRDRVSLDLSSAVSI